MYLLILWVTDGVFFQFQVCIHHYVRNNPDLLDDIRSVLQIVIQGKLQRPTTLTDFAPHQDVLRDVEGEMVLGAVSMVCGVGRITLS